MQLCDSCAIQRVLDFCLFSVHSDLNYLPLRLTHNVINKVDKSLACCLWLPSELSLCLDPE